MLHVAVAVRQSGMVSLLLEYDADPFYLHFNHTRDPYSWAFLLWPLTLFLHFHL